MKLQFCEDLKTTLEKQEHLEIPVEWESKGNITQQYLNRAFGNAYDFSQGGQ